jgi:hypothetical protein
VREDHLGLPDQEGVDERRDRFRVQETGHPAGDHQGMVLGPLRGEQGDFRPFQQR